MKISGIMNQVIENYATSFLFCRIKMQLQQYRNTVELITGRIRTERGIGPVKYN